MAIFARLVLLLFSIISCAAIGGLYLPTLFDESFATAQQYAIVGVILGAIVGANFGSSLCKIVTGDPPKD
jgi:hypothetical protein